MDRFLFLFEAEEWKEGDEAICRFDFCMSLLRVGTDRTFPSSAGSSSFVIWLVTSFYFPDCVSRARIYTHRVISEFSFVVMARGDISVMPANVPEDMDWVEDVVLLSKSVVDEELLASFREERVCYYNLGHPEERHFIYMYECLFSKLGVRVPFTQFEQDVLFNCRVAPTQLHPNSWGFMKAFQSVCWYLQLDLSLRAFLYFFHLTRPFSQKKSRWASFRAREGRRIFSLYEESFHDFKNYYFKEDQEVVTVLKECCAKAPFNTKTLLTRSPSYIRTELEKITNNSDAYKRMRARKKNQANRLAAALGSKDDPKSSSSPVSRAPPLGSENQSASGPETQPATEGPEFKVPKTPATAADQSKTKKRKGFGHSYGSVYSPDFDWQESDIDYNSEPERTLLRRRREARRRARQSALEQQLNMAAEHHDDNLNLENNQN
ncbi:hypothetical protein PIB30_026353 [Stylosanthes scabra]|uniref:Transposase (putative) gypsy type domain-containing protein n=1 Tax=Stylosanthes scabra TaxID=79078 RepID=A0ABU6ZA30_9FABA|nr:hypothetical protein [Stylosanthes scabra]